MTNGIGCGCRGGEGISQAVKEVVGGGAGDGVGDEPSAAGGVFVGDDPVVEGEFAVRYFREVVGVRAGEFFELGAELITKKADRAASKRDGWNRV